MTKLAEYRKTIELDPDTKYHWVQLGPIPGLPDWHVQSQPSRWPFPTPEAAMRFAKAHKERDPLREVAVASLGGETIFL